MLQGIRSAFLKKKIGWQLRYEIKLYIIKIERDQVFENKKKSNLNFNPNIAI